MSEQEKKDLRAKIKKGLNQGYENLLRRKAALGQDVITADSEGKPVAVAATVMLEKRNVSSQN